MFTVKGIMLCKQQIPPIPPDYCTFALIKNFQNETILYSKLFEFIRFHASDHRGAGCTILRNRKITIFGNIRYLRPWDGITKTNGPG